MSDIETNGTDIPLEPEKKKSRKITKTETTPDPSIKTTDEIEDNEKAREAITRLIKNSVEKYSGIVDNQLKNTRDDFECLQGIVSEFLEDFMIIGHTLDGQRVVIRYTSTPAQLDSLTELCKKVLVRMMSLEQTGQ